ncbi:unnamed protein product [Orchesella dallaii]|uniref:NEDD8-activating enzyme E1 catalytic subunit n=1 Tax=Orchesella dallaii TaxID=48710 RepID=A0ABP1RYP5_9HEXA
MGSKAGDSVDIPPERHAHVRKLLERPGPFTHPEFEPSKEAFDGFSSIVRVLIVGAGGLGCELLKNLSLLGVKQLHVIDMDTIDISNLNRQFLFRMTDVGSSKSETASKFINGRVQGAQVVAHHCKIQDKDSEFYRSFHVIVCGLDSIVARRWLNSMVCSLVEYNEDGSVKEETLIPIIDGGTEGFKGNARVIMPTMSPCIECTLDLYPPQVNFPLCTIANTPRLPEHCIEYVRILQWPKDNPFETETAIDGDDPNHINWIYEKSLERASQFGITGVTYRLTQGVVKRIIPAVASTNAVIAAACATEVFKLATSCSIPMDNYMVFSDVEGIYTYTYKAEKKVRYDHYRLFSLNSS